MVGNLLILIIPIASCNLFPVICAYMCVTMRSGMVQGSVGCLELGAILLGGETFILNTEASEGNDKYEVSARGNNVLIAISVM